VSRECWVTLGRQASEAAAYSIAPRRLTVNWFTPP
jgi:hypothetical protein